MKRIWLSVLGLVSLVSLACAAPGQPADPPEATDTVLVLRISTKPANELIEVSLTGQYGPHLLDFISAPDGKLLKNYVPTPPIVAPWGWDFRLNAETPLPLQGVALVTASKGTRITCEWYKGLESTKPVWNDQGVGRVICKYLWGRDK